MQAEATKKLIDAATSGDLKQVVLLLSLGADMETRDEVSAAEGYWCPSLFSSTSYLPPPQPDPLLASLPAVHALCSPFNQDGRTVLYVASWKGKLDVAKYLVEHGADVNAANKVSPSRGRRAPSSAREDCTPPLLASSPAVLALCSPFHQNGWTALMIASQNGPATVESYLGSRGLGKYLPALREFGVTNLEVRAHALGEIERSEGEEEEGRGGGRLGGATLSSRLCPF